MRLLLLAFIACTLCVAGCASNKSAGLNTEPIDTTRERVSRSFEDPARVKSMLAVLDAFEAEMESHASTVKSLREQIVEENADYATSREELERLYAELGEQTQLIADTLRDRHFELKAMCTPEEWAAIMPTNPGLVRFGF